MAAKKRILLVTQELNPYTAQSELSDLINNYAQILQKNNMEVRILMPKFGVINERRHRLHEVVRLSGMNITVNDEEFPLIIKVASLPGTRMQVYFLDNDVFFKSKEMFNDAEGNFKSDNLDKSIFFCKGIVETVKKFGWSPDIVHCNGWMSSLLPALLKNNFEDEPIFRESKIVYTSYDCDHVNDAFLAQFPEKAKANLFDEVNEKFIVDSKLDLNQGAIEFADCSLSVMNNELVINSQEDEDLEAYMQLFQELFVTHEENA